MALTRSQGASVAQRPNENELKLKRGMRNKYRIDVGKALIEYEVLGLVWEDATGKKNDPLFVPQYYVWHYSVN